jgi:hypothetical protein
VYQAHRISHARVSPTRSGNRPLNLSNRIREGGKFTLIQSFNSPRISILMAASYRFLARYDVLLSQLIFCAGCGFQFSESGLVEWQKTDRSAEISMGDVPAWGPLAQCSGDLLFILKTAVGPLRILECISIASSCREMVCHPKGELRSSWNSEVINGFHFKSRFNCRF